MAASIELMTPEQKEVVLRLVGLVQVSKDQWYPEDHQFFREVRDAIQRVGSEWTNRGTPGHKGRAGGNPEQAGADRGPEPVSVGENREPNDSSQFVLELPSDTLAGVQRQSDEP